MGHHNSRGSTTVELGQALRRTDIFPMTFVNTAAQTAGAGR